MMQPEFNNKQRKLDIFKKSMTDLIMGPFYILWGGFVLLYKYLPVDIGMLRDFIEGNIIVQVCAIAAVLYGSWRVYRGIKKDYY